MIPQFKNKFSSQPFITPERYIQYMRERGRYPKIKPPRGVIICYQSSIFSHAITDNAVERGDGFAHRLHFFSETKNEIAITRPFGIGAPAAAALLEELIAWGVKRFISLGTAGTLQPQISVGDLVLCDRAIRDEGTSFHYSAVEKYSLPDPELSLHLEEELRKAKLDFHKGSTWTIDAPYQETIDEIKSYQQEGVATVDMEASALFAVAKHRGAKIAAMFSVSDSLTGVEWNPQFHHSTTKQGLENIFAAARNAL